MTTGTSLLCLSSWQRLIPSMPGSIMSRRTRSNAPANRKRSSAASPSATASTLNPSRSRAICIISLTAGSSSTISILGICACLRQLDLDRGPYPFSGANRDAATHSLGKVLADGQPETEAFGTARAPVETLENVWKIDGAYPNSLVLHGNGARLRTNLDVSAPVGVLDGVAEQNHKHLLEPFGIGANATTLAFGEEPEPTALSERFHQLGRLQPRFPQVYCIQVGLPLVPTYPG